MWLVFLSSMSRATDFSKGTEKFDALEGSGESSQLLDHHRGIGSHTPTALA